MPRTMQTLPEATSDGLLGLIMKYLDGNWLANDFPERCQDTDRNHIFSTNVVAFELHAKALIPELQTPLFRNRGDIADETVFDLLELVGRFVALPMEGKIHPFFSHHPLTLHRPAGTHRYRDDVNEILARGGAAFEIQEDLTITHIGPIELQDILSALNPDT